MKKVDDLRKEAYIKAGQIWCLYSEVEKFKKIYKLKLSIKDLEEIDFLMGLLEKYKVSTTDQDSIVKLNDLYSKIYDSLFKIVKKLKTEATEIKQDIETKDDIVQQNYILSGYIWAIYSDIEKLKIDYNVELSEKDQKQLDLYMKLFNENKISSQDEHEMVKLMYLYSKIYRSLSIICEKLKKSANVEYNKNRDNIIENSINKISVCIKENDIKGLSSLCHFDLETSVYYINLYNQIKNMVTEENELDALQLVADLCEFSGINFTLDQEFKDSGYNSQLR